MTNEEIRKILEEYTMITWQVSQMMPLCEEGFSALWALERHLQRLADLLPPSSGTITVNGRQFPVTVTQTKCGEYRAWVSEDDGDAGPFILEDGYWGHNFHTEVACFARKHRVAPKGTPTGEVLDMLRAALNTKLQ